IREFGVGILSCSIVMFGLAPPRSSYLKLEFCGRKQTVQLLYTWIHTLDASKSVACASTVVLFTREWTSEVLASFHLQILEQLDYLRGNGYYKLKQLAPTANGQLEGTLVRIHSQVGTLVSRLQDQFTLQLLQPLSSSVHYRMCDTALR
ncbi:hypothetical protein MKW92_030684, partial [Papaver armeniacum]